MKILIAALLSIAIFWLVPQRTPVNNLEQTAAVTKPAKQPRHTTVHLASDVTPVSTPAPQQAIAQTGCDSYRNMFQNYDWDVNTAIAICKAESNGNILAISPTCDRGLMQINCIHADMVENDLNALYDPSTNISVAHRVYLSQGWNGWTTYKTGAYLRYL